MSRGFKIALAVLVLVALVGGGLAWWWFYGKGKAPAKPEEEKPIYDTTPVPAPKDVDKAKIYEDNSKIPEGKFVPRQLIIRFKDDKAKESYLEEFKDKIESKSESPQLGTFTLFLKEGEDPKEWIKKAVDDERVVYAELNQFIKLKTRQSSLPGDYNPQTQFYLEKINAPGGWTDTVRGSSQTKTIAIIDSSFNIDHEDLTESIFDTGDPPGGGDQNNNGYLDDQRGWDFSLWKLKVQNNILSYDPNVKGDNNVRPDLLTGTQPYLEEDTYYGDNQHGTAVAGVAAATTNNGKGIAGTGYRLKILPIKLFGNYLISQDNVGCLGGGNLGEVYRVPLQAYCGTSEQVATAVRYAYGFPSVVAINMSFGGPALAPNQTLVSALQEAKNRGIALIGATGNDACNIYDPNTTCPAYYVDTDGDGQPDTRLIDEPTSYPEVAAVSATKRDDTWADVYANFGDKTEFTAPGGDAVRVGDNTFPNSIYTILGVTGTAANQTLSNNGYGDRFTLSDIVTNFSGWTPIVGTSFSAPQVAAAAALVKLVFPDLDNLQARAQLAATADRGGNLGGELWNKNRGFGRINLQAAVSPTNGLNKPRPFGFSNGGIYYVIDTDSTGQTGRRRISQAAFQALFPNFSGLNTAVSDQIKAVYGVRRNNQDNQDIDIDGELGSLIKSLDSSDIYLIQNVNSVGRKRKCVLSNGNLPPECSGTVRTMGSYLFGNIPEGDPITIVSPPPPPVEGENKNVLRQSVTQVIADNKVIAAINSYFLQRGLIEGRKCVDLQADPTLSGVVCDNLYQSNVSVGTSAANQATYLFSPGEPRYSRGGVLYQSNTQVLDATNKVLASFVSYILGRPAIQIFGDVFASGSIYGGKIDFLNQNIASSSGEITSANVFEKIPGYKIDKAAAIFWDTTSTAPPNKVQAMEDNIGELGRRASVFIGDKILSGPTYLDTLTATATGNVNFRPEGWVWKIKGNLTLRNVEFCGKGTIIVSNEGNSTKGNLTIENRLGASYLSSCPDTSVGFIVQGSTGVTLKTDVESVKGAFFVPNGLFKIEPNGSPTLTIKGSIVSKTFELNKRTATTGGYGVIIQYDNNVAKNTPPGFREIIVLSGTEAPSQ